MKPAQIDLSQSRISIKHSFVGAIAVYCTCETAAHNVSVVAVPGICALKSAFAVVKSICSAFCTNDQFIAARNPPGHFTKDAARNVVSGRCRIDLYFLCLCCFSRFLVCDTFNGLLRVILVKILLVGRLNNFRFVRGFAGPLFVRIDAGLFRGGRRCSDSGVRLFFARRRRRIFNTGIHSGLFPVRSHSGIILIRFRDSCIFI